MPGRRLLVALGVLALAGLAAVVVTAWLAWAVIGDLRGAESAAARLRAAVVAGDPAGASSAADDLARAGASAHDRTSGPWWGAVSHLPVVGDDARGMAAAARVFDLVGREGTGPALSSARLVDRVSRDGRVDLGVIRRLRAPVGAGASVFEQAERELAAVDTSGMVGPLGVRCARLSAEVASLSSEFAAARTAVDVLPGLLGADGPRTYLLVLANNAEVRATGGLPGSWAVLHVRDGRLRLGPQGAAGAFPVRGPVLPLTAAERALYGEQLGSWWQDATVTPDFPRAADLLAAHWRQAGGEPLDGVVSLDTVALSYLLRGTGPVSVGPASVDAANVVRFLLSTTYAEVPEPALQDARYEAVTRAVFSALTGPLRSPRELVVGVAEAAGEGRLLVRSFDPREQSLLAGTRVAGELDRRGRPAVDVSLQDATGAKMSYYLSSSASVVASSCSGGVQALSGSLRLSSTVTRREVRTLPAYVTGGGRYGTSPGSQLLLVRLHGPYGGWVGDVRVGGAPASPEVVVEQGRPAVVLSVLLAPGEQREVTWSMRSGRGQTGDPDVRVTPGIEPGSPLAGEVATAC